MSVFMIDADAEAKLLALKDYAENHTFSYERMIELSKMTPEEIGPVGEAFKVIVPVDYVLCFTVENQGPHTGLCRHMSLQSPRPGRAPIPMALDMVMPLLGFTGDFHSCQVWTEHPSEGGVAVHVLEPMDERVRQSLMA